MGKILEYIKKVHKFPLLLDIVDFEEELDDVSRLDEALLEIKNNVSIHGPQGTKCTYGGESFDSKWELCFYRYHKEIQMDAIERNHKIFLPYTDETGKLRKFYPDFVVNGIYYEIKGIWRPSDITKQNCCPQVKFMDSTDMKPIIKEMNKKIPNWASDYIPR